MRQETVAAQNESAEQMIRRMTDDVERAKAAIQSAQDYQKKYADRSRRPVEYQEGDQVLLSTRDLPVGDQKRKLTEKYCGPMKIVQVISPVVIGWNYHLH
jgi:hypothetical protein